MVDFIRHGYRTRMRLWADSDELTEVEWFFAPPDAKWIEEPHGFCASIHDAAGATRLDVPDYHGPGEPWPSPYRQTAGRNPAGYTGQHWCGPLSVTLTGGVHGVTPEIVTDERGTTPCCEATPPLAGGGEIQGGTGFEMATVEEVPPGGEIQGGSAVFGLSTWANGWLDGWLDGWMGGGGGGEPVATFSGARVSRTSDETLGSFSDEITFTEVIYDTDDYYDPAHPTRLRAPFTGYYATGACAVFDVPTGGSYLYFLDIRRSGAEAIVSHNSLASEEVFNPALHVATHLHLVAGDYLEVRVVRITYSGTDPVKVLNFFDYTPEFWVTFLGPGEL